MAYTPVTWVQDVTKVGPTNLNHLEGGVSDAHTDIAALDARLDTAESNVTSLVAADVSLGTRLDTAESDIAALEASPVVPSGVMLPYAGAVAPTGYLLCDGTSYLRTAHAALFAALGGASSPWGLADGTHFNVPDMRGRVAVGKGTHTDVDTLAESDGSVLADRRVKHKHTVNDPTHSHNSFGSGHTLGGGLTSIFTNAASASDGDAASTRPASTGITVGPQSDSPTDGPAYLVVNHIIKT